jgi:putative ABC transport system ATP-binding protein
MTANAQLLIDIQDLWKIYPGPEGEVSALAGVRLQVQRGSYIAIMGPSGSGKSTLLSILGCLDSPSRGSYRIDGRSVEKLTDDALAEVRNAKLGFVFQAFHLLSNQTALGNVMLPLVYSRRFSRGGKRRAEEALRIVGLTDRMHHYPKQMSGGQKQRVAIARALVTDPVVLLADEPTGALDSKSTSDVLDLFSSLHSMGRTIVVVTHEPEVAARAQRLVMIRDGAIVADGTPKAVLKRHASALGFLAGGEA